MTGKAKVEYYFDPALLLPDDSDAPPAARTPSKARAYAAVDERQVRDALLYSSKHLFVPCTIVKDLEEGNGSNGALVKTSDGVLHKIRVSVALQSVSPTSCM